ncbi:MAG TPA: type II CAAX endopeptidase family protein [Solirubrobacteraceae bacterium]|nr:type II CAAX endopeptidase family protein [Solirubrobacteraceae bacterium]
MDQSFLELPERPTQAAVAVPPPPPPPPPAPPPLLPPPVWVPTVIWPLPPMPPERPARAHAGLAALRYRLDSPARRSRPIAALRIVLGPLALLVALIGRLAVALTLPLAWCIVLVRGCLPVRWHVALARFIGWINRVRAFAWLATDVLGPLGRGEPARIELLAPRTIERRRTLAWLVRAPATLFVRYLATWLLAATALVSLPCLLIAGRQPRPVQRMLRATLEYIARGDPYLLLLSDHVPRLPEPRPRAEASTLGPVTLRWPAIAWLWASLFAIGFTVLLAFPLVAAFAVGGHRLSTRPAFDLVAGALQSLVILASALVVARLYGHPTARQFGLDRVRFWRSAGWASLSLLAFVLLFAALLAPPALTFGSMRSQLGPYRHSAAPVLIGAFFAIAVLAPICEEILFRGVLFGALRRWRGVWPAAAITAAVFSAAHLEFAPALFIDRLAVGFIWSLLYAKTGRLLPGMMAHAANNAVVIGIQRGWSWQIPLAVAACVCVVAFLVWPVAWRAGRRKPGPQAVMA